MSWQYWLALYLDTHCVARGLHPSTIAAYRAALLQFQRWCQQLPEVKPPQAVTPRDVLEYLEYLRRVRDNGAAAVNLLNRRKMVATFLEIQSLCLTAAPNFSHKDDSTQAMHGVEYRVRITCAR